MYLKLGIVIIYTYSNICIKLLLSRIKDYFSTESLSVLIKADCVVGK